MTVESSRSFQKLEDLQTAGTIPYQFTDGVTRQVGVGRIAGYLRPDNPSSVVPYHWDDDDFSAVVAFLENLIIELGWKR